MTASWCTGKAGALISLSGHCTALSKHRDCIMVHGKNRRTDIIIRASTALSKHRDGIMVHGKNRRTDITVRSGRARIKRFRVRSMKSGDRGSNRSISSITTIIIIIISSSSSSSSCKTPDGGAKERAHNAKGHY